MAKNVLTSLSFGVIIYVSLIVINGRVNLYALIDY